jgi:hypothetical protein
MYWSPQYRIQHRLHNGFIAIWLEAGRECSPPVLGIYSWSIPSPPPPPSSSYSSLSPPPLSLLLFYLIYFRLLLKDFVTPDQGGYYGAVDPKKSVSHRNEGSSVYVHALLQLLGNIFQLFTPHLTSTHLTPDLRTI